MTAEEALLTYNQMIVGIVEEEDRADRLFGALANSTRRDIVRRTMKDDYSVSQLARCYTTSFAAIQKHVSILEAAGLVSKRSSGREQIVTGDINTIEDVHAPVSYTHLRAHETVLDLVCRLLLEKKKHTKNNTRKINYVN